jgi:hypothetical protein
MVGMRLLMPEEPDKNLWDHVFQRGDGVLYRYEEERYYSSLDDALHTLTGYNLKVVLREFPVIKFTPKGAWIEKWGPPGKQWIQFGTFKKFACLTKEEALESFRARKRKQVKILQAQLKRAEEALRLAEGMSEEEAERVREEAV